MIGLGSLRLLLTLMFVVTSCFHLVRCLPVAGRRACDSPAVEAVHLLMGLSMIAMIGPWAAVVPVLWWVLVFGCAGIWFTVRAVRTGGRGPTYAYLASMTGAMAWMGLSELLTAPATVAGHPGHGMAPAADTRPGALVSATLGVYLITAGCWWWARGMRVATLGERGAATARESIQWHAVCHGLMSAGMGLVLLAVA